MVRRVTCVGMEAEYCQCFEQVWSIDIVGIVCRCEGEQLLVLYAGVEDISACSVCRWNA